MAISANMAAEIQRKARAGIPLDISTPEKMKIYNQYKAPSTGNSNTVGGMSATESKKGIGATSNGSIPPAVSNAANSPGSNPLYGFGSGGKYGSTPGLGAAYAANKALISTPEGLESERQRTLSVIAARKAAGMDTSEQERYLTMNLGYKPPEVQAQGSIPSNLQGDPVYNTRSGSDLQQIAQDETALERAALLNAINSQMASVRNNAEYANQLISDNRVLEDQALLRNKNPFSGGTNYQLAMVQRGRSIDDTSRASALENSLNSLQQEIANFDKLTPERQRQIYNELLQIERNFGLNVGQLTGQYGGQQTLAARTADQNYGLNYAGLFGTLPGNGSSSSVFRSGTGAPMTLAAQNQQWSQEFDQKQFDRGVYESDRAFDYTKERNKIADERWEKEFDEDRRRFGLNYALDQLQLKQSNANAAASRSQSAENARIANLFDIWDRTGVAPEGIPGVQAGTRLSGGQGGMTPQDMQKESSAMISALRSGQMTPDQALRQIQDDESLGIYSPENANYLRSQVERISREVPRAEASQEVLSQAQATMPPDEVIEGEARSRGYPIMDYKQWYKARDGRLAGLSYPDWARLYGPTIGPRQ